MATKDGLEGNYVKGLPKYSYAAHKSEYRGLAYDADGTITGWSGVTIVPDRPFFTSSMCEARPHWGNILLPTFIVETTDNASRVYQSMYDRIIDKCQGLKG